MPSTTAVADPVAYYEMRQQALQLVHGEQWAEAVPILRQLTSQYSDDGDTWYLLGLAYFQTSEWRNAIAALEKTLNLGAALHGIPTGSVPSNDIMVRIAEAHAHLDEESQSIAWLEKALAARWDERHSLIGHAGFSNLADSESFKRISGSALSELERNQAWDEDLDFLVESIQRLHVDMYHAISPDVFQHQVDTLRQKLPSLTDQQIMVAFMKLLGSMGNGHNLVVPVYSTKGSLLKLPLEFYWFSDGLHVVAADDQYRDLIGSKIEMFGSMPADQAARQTMQVNARDNEMQHLLLSPFYLALPAVLESLGIVETADELSLTLTRPSGSSTTVQPAPRAFDFSGFPTLPSPPGVKQPLYLARVNEAFWSERLPDGNTLFVQFNAVADREEQSLKQFNEALRAEISQQPMDTLILDLRHNSGGNGSILPPMLRTLIYFETSHPKGQLFVIMGRKTFSAGHELLTQISTLTNAVLVGEPSGSRPNARSESGWFVLPYSGIRGIVSSQYHQPSAPEDHRIWIAPHVPVSLSSDDYFKGKDPALEAILNIAGKQHRR
jgi:tetratricopeptide (TPR) repeat protein